MVLKGCDGVLGLEIVWQFGGWCRAKCNAGSEVCGLGPLSWAGNQALWPLLRYLATVRHRQLARTHQSSHCCATIVRLRLIVAIRRTLSTRNWALLSADQWPTTGYTMFAVVGMLGKRDESRIKVRIAGVGRCVGNECRSK